jgi:hypothetical protein
VATGQSSTVEHAVTRSFRKVGQTKPKPKRVLQVAGGVTRATLFGQCGDVSATMAGKQLRLTVLDGELVVARLPFGTPAPAWASEFHPPLTTMTRTADEVSLVGPAGLALPDNAKVIARTHACWRCTRSLLHPIKTSRSCASLE